MDSINHIIYPPAYACTQEVEEKWGGNPKNPITETDQTYDTRGSGIDLKIRQYISTNTLNGKPEAKKGTMDEEEGVPQKIIVIVQINIYHYLTLPPCNTSKPPCN